MKKTSEILEYKCEHCKKTIRSLYATQQEYNIKQHQKKHENKKEVI